ncbi:MAG TPA: 2-phospho-L-lactate guanylyltransferase [Solirubrobacteraceae bacterium]|jgi:2-phospho-L-lactate guanylyltransferase|nr:2-phospho-L-lactate guanylyltransferase [Solirubrobacteraceae bacterium]
MRTAAILPVKRFSAAKSRLGASGVAETLRQRLARAMVADVLQALAQTDSIELTIVVTREPSLAELAAEHGALLLADTAEAGQSAAVALGVQRALADGIERVLCIPGDCPALDPAELDALLAVADSRASDRAEVTIVPDRHGTGTNGLLLTPPDAIEPAFGPGSCERHRSLARAAGARCEIERPASLLLDVDTGADLAALQDRLGATRAAAVRTRAVLGQPERHQIIPISAD